MKKFRFTSGSGIHALALVALFSLVCLMYNTGPIFRNGQIRERHMKQKANQLIVVNGAARERGNDYQVNKTKDVVGAKVKTAVDVDIFLPIYLQRRCLCSRKLMYPPQASFDNSSVFNRARVVLQDDNFARWNSSCSDEGTLYQKGQNVMSTFLMLNPNEGSERVKYYQRHILGNLEMMRKHYPGYSLRLYTNLELNFGDLFCDILCKNQDVFWCDIGRTPSHGLNISNMIFTTWRFIALLDPTVSSFHSRDLDSFERNGSSVVDDLQHSLEFSSFENSMEKSGKEFWNSVHPQFQCPVDKLTLVGVADGGKWTCGINHLGNMSLHNSDPPCFVYSFGVYRDSTFEAEIIKNTQCTVYAHDPTVNQIGKPLKATNTRVHFFKLGIGAEDKGNLKTLETLMRENGGHKWIDILKMDVEGAEFTSLAKIINSFGGELPFGQLLVEFHVGGEWRKVDKEMVAVLIIQLESMGLRMFSKEINKYFPNYSSEFSFINLKALHRYLSEGDIKMIIDKSNLN